MSISHQPFVAGSKLNPLSQIPHWLHGSRATGSGEGRNVAGQRLAHPQPTTLGRPRTQIVLVYVTTNPPTRASPGLLIEAKVNPAVHTSVVDVVGDLFERREHGRQEWQRRDRQNDGMTAVAPD